MEPTPVCDQLTVRSSLSSRHSTLTTHSHTAVGLVYHTRGCSLLRSQRAPDALVPVLGTRAPDPSRISKIVDEYLTNIHIACCSLVVAMHTANMHHASMLFTVPSICRVMAHRELPLAYAAASSAPYGYAGPVYPMPYDYAAQAADRKYGYAPPASSFHRGYRYCAFPMLLILRFACAAVRSRVVVVALHVACAAAAGDKY